MNYRGLAVLALTLCSGRLAQAAPPIMKSYDHPGFALVVIDGNQTRKGGMDQGMVKCVTAPLSQVLYWTVPTGSLRQRAEHERSLIRQAAEGGTSQPEVSAYQESASPGNGSIGWTARIENTRFASTVIDCGKHHILLTTMGPTLSEVQSAHAVSVRSLRCK